MLSDEEKRAIETIKDFKNLKWYEHAFDNGTEVLDEEQKQDIEIILNLIEKQSKEIEELEKENWIMRCVDKQYISKDKIKAKIEDLKENSNGDNFNLTNVIMLFKSLLKKEQ